MKEYFATLEELGYPEKEIKGRSHLRKFVRPRMALYYVARNSGKTFSEIGRELNRDHSTIIHGYEVAKWDMETDEELREIINALMMRRETVLKYWECLRLLKDVQKYFDEIDIVKDARNDFGLDRVILVQILQRLNFANWQIADAIELTDTQVSRAKAKYMRLNKLEFKLANQVIEEYFAFKEGTN